MDLFHTPQGSTAVAQQWFYARGGDWQPYELPRGCSQVFMFGVGAGGGAGGGFTAGTGTARGGGGGGASGAVMRALYWRFSLPDLLYIQPGMGVGTGGAGATSTNGLNGPATYVAAQPNSSALYL